MLPDSLEVKCRRWIWIAHVCKMPKVFIPRVATRWSADGERVSGRPKETW